MLVALGTLLLAASALSVKIPPKNCSDIKVQSEGNCPRKGYECDEAFGITYNARNSNWHTAEITCTDERAQLAVDHKIVEKIRCRDQKWRVQGGCDFPTTSVVCAKYCDVKACPAAPRHPPREYTALNIREATLESKCAFAKCKYGFVALHRNGSLIEEFPASTQVTCGGSGLWSVSDKKFAYVMCKRGPKTCRHDCNDKPWRLPNLNATSAATSNGCSYSCPANQVLSRAGKSSAIALTCATCTRSGFLVDNDKIVKRIGCITCDIPDGPVPNIGIVSPPRRPATSKGCVATCPKHTKLRYSLGTKSRFARGNILYRQFLPNGNQWITVDGKTIGKAYRIECVRKEECDDWEDWEHAK